MSYLLEVQHFLNGVSIENKNVVFVSSVKGVSTTDKPAEESAPDSREVAFNKVAGKTFPSLVVLARPHLKDKEMSPQFISKERAVLGESSTTCNSFK